MIQKLDHRAEILSIEVLFSSRSNKLTMIPVQGDFHYHVFLLPSA